MMNRTPCAVMLVSFLITSGTAVSTSLRDTGNSSWLRNEIEQSVTGSQSAPEWQMNDINPLPEKVAKKLSSSSPPSTSGSVKGDLDDQCPSWCYCDKASSYVSCVAESRALNLSWPPISRTVVRLEVKNVQFEQFTFAMVSALDKLQELKFTQSTLRTIQNSSFLNNVRLERLDLSDNLLTNLNGETFRGLESSLEHLDISDNNLTCIDEVFTRLTALEQLNLRRNQLTSISISTFLGLKRLEYLNLDTNHLHTIEVGSFIHLPHLGHLVLSNNPLDNLTRIDSVSTRLQYVDLTNTGLEHVPQGIDPFVRDLRLAGNGISSIEEGQLDNYGYLSLLVLDDNRLEVVEDDAFGRLSYLSRLWLNGNKLQLVPSNLPSSLRQLFVEDNLIPALNSTSLSGLTALRILSLSRNVIRTVDLEAFDDLISLQHIDLSANQLQVLDFPFLSKCSKLQWLDLSNNYIKQLSGEPFKGLANLQTLHMNQVRTPSSELNLTGNIFEPLVNIDHFELEHSPGLADLILSSDDLLGSLRTVTELNLIGNNLETLRTSFVDHLNNIKVIKLNNNSWSCDNRLSWLVNWMKMSSLVHFYLAYDVKCSKPLSVSSRPLMTLNIDQLSQHNTSTSSRTPEPSIAVSTASSSSPSDSGATFTPLPSPGPFEKVTPKAVSSITGSPVIRSTTVRTVLRTESGQRENSSQDSAVLKNDDSKVSATGSYFFQSVKRMKKNEKVSNNGSHVLELDGDEIGKNSTESEYAITETSAKKVQTVEKFDSSAAVRTFQNISGVELVSKDNETREKGA
ncbi:Leucine-rich repeat-containing protein 15 [Halotydeus destructor]|nr:Leucine-rich repeat-containing protein 15 [Halotydeus destructor]